MFIILLNFRYPGKKKRSPDDLSFCFGPGKKKESHGLFFQLVTFSPEPHSISGNGWHKGNSTCSL